MVNVGVEPYREVTFDADGDIDVRQRDRLAELDVTDLVMFAHGWNNDRRTANRLYDRFLAPFPGLMADEPGVRLGYVGIMWPSIRFADEPIPDFEPRGAVAPRVSPGLDDATRQALVQAFPGREQLVERLAALLDECPEERTAFDEFGMLIRQLVEEPQDRLAVLFGSDIESEDHPQSDPMMLHEDTLAVCVGFTDALEEAGADLDAGSAPGITLGGGLKKVWNGAKELLRQATYYAMKRRSGTVGRLGLGPLLGELARTSPSMRVHLVGHSQGARVVSFALHGLPEGVRNVKSVTLLQGAFSHYAFAGRLPHSMRGGGALRDAQRRIDGPLVACYSHHDTALGVIYPLASRLAGDAVGLIAPHNQWGAVGYDGVQAVADTPTLTVAQALRQGMPDRGCVNVDASALVRRGGPPAGAHNDVCHADLARVVLAAGRVGR
ncbi:serine-threonine protein kinase [Streptomyces sp. H27-C3]|uniref:serine-threonine protein kinase n=1 Tax=Streptomyces sp. H27-C3 TaxID=3046305 RepID=UPI0024BA4E9B|nr:serine-threonine protein kinase [Streptomyces sp. H27-C3]MDJ0463389.1 serine-threonine protein kinase [Streptomyces sp. H27-C3]